MHSSSATPSSSQHYLRVIDVTRVKVRSSSDAERSVSNYPPSISSPSTPMTPSYTYIIPDPSLDHIHHRHHTASSYAQKRRREGDVEDEEEEEDENDDDDDDEDEDHHEYHNLPSRHNNSLIIMRFLIGICAFGLFYFLFVQPYFESRSFKVISSGHVAAVVASTSSATSTVSSAILNITSPSSVISPPSLSPPLAPRLLSSLHFSALTCPPSSTSASTSYCDFRWGSPLRHVDGTREDFVAELNKTDVRLPQDGYTYEMKIITGDIVTATRQQRQGLLIRIQQRDLCCQTRKSDPPLPIAHFRVVVYGRAQASIPVVMRIGGEEQLPASSPSSLPSSTNLILRHITVFLPLPDSGLYLLEVHLTHYNTSSNMMHESYQPRSTAYEARSGLWVDGKVKEKEKEVDQVRFKLENDDPSSKPESLPLCGSPQAEEDAKKIKFIVSHEEDDENDPESFSLPAPGRWLLMPHLVASIGATNGAAGIPPSASSNSSAPYIAAALDLIRTTDYTQHERRWLFTQSLWMPYACRYDYTTHLKELIHSALIRTPWIHFVGDSNTKGLFTNTLCPTLKGKIVHPPGEMIDRWMDPPFVCVEKRDGKDNTREATATTDPDTISLTTTPWILTFDRWHLLGKPNLLDQPANYSFSWKDQCARWPMKVGDPLTSHPQPPYYGWYKCHQVKSPVITSADSPHATYFSIGSHAFELGDSPTTTKLLSTSLQGVLVPYFNSHATIFPLTTAIHVGSIPMKFGMQSRMFNNERILALNRQVIMLRRKEWKMMMKEGRISPHSWSLMLDLYSPTHAAYEYITADAVHFISYLYEQHTRWVLHYLVNAPNFEGKRV